MPDFHIITSFVALQSYEVTQWKRYHKSWIELWVQPRRKVYRCPICGKELTSYYNRRWTRLRDLNIARHIVYVWVPHYLVDCPSCGVHEIALTIARRMPAVRAGSSTGFSS